VLRVVLAHGPPLALGEVRAEALPVARAARVLVHALELGRRDVGGGGSAARAAAHLGLASLSGCSCACPRSRSRSSSLACGRLRGSKRRSSGLATVNTTRVAASDRTMSLQTPSAAATPSADVDHSAAAEVSPRTLARCSSVRK